MVTTAQPNNPAVAPWRQQLAGQTAWVQIRGKWQRGTIVSFGRNRGEATRVTVSLASGAIVRRADELYWEKRA